MRSSILATLFAVAALPAFSQVVTEPAERTIRAGKLRTVSLAISPKEDQLLVGLEKGAELYELQSGKKRFMFPYFEDGGTAVYHVGFNENGEYVLLIGHSGKRVVWGVKTGRQEASLQQHRWVPDPRAVKAMGLDMKNSTFDRFYQQTEVKIGERTARSGENGVVDIVDADGKLVQQLKAPDNTDQHHRAPLLLWKEWLLVGADDGRVLFYKLVP